MADIGLQTVVKMREMSQIDDQWSVDHERGFSWWPQQLAQHVWAELPEEVEAVLVMSRVHIRTDVCTGFGGTMEEFAQLNAISRMMTLSGFVRKSDDPQTLQLACALSVHEQAAEDLSIMISLASTIQLVEAYLWAQMAEKVGTWYGAATAHPIGGYREEADDMLNLLSDVVVPAGKEPSRWAGDEMAKLEGMVEHPLCVLANGNQNGITAEYPYPGGPRCSRSKREWRIRDWATAA